jgi:hypothetical protein
MVGVFLRLEGYLEYERPKMRCRKCPSIVEGEGLVRFFRSSSLCKLRLLYSHVHIVPKICENDYFFTDTLKIMVLHKINVRNSVYRLELEEIPCSTICTVTK